MFNALSLIFNHLFNAIGHASVRIFDDYSNIFTKEKIGCNLPYILFTMDFTSFFVQFIINYGPLAINQEIVQAIPITQFPKLLKIY